MRRRYRNVIGALLVLMCLLGQANQAHAELSIAEATDTGFRVVVTESSGTLEVPGAGGGAGDPGDVMVVVNSCAEQLVGVVDCSLPFERYCAGRPGDDAANQWRPALMMSRRDATANALATGSWTCLNFIDAPGAGPTREQIRAALDAALPQAAATTNPMISPTTGMIETLARLPLILHYDQPRQITVQDALAGRQVRIIAYAESFRWQAGPTTVDTPDTGRPYESASPCYPDACPTYLTAAGFDRTGRYPLTLTVRWIGSYQIDDGPPIAIDGIIERTSPTLTINVRQARTELISGEDND